MRGHDGGGGLEDVSNSKSFVCSHGRLYGCMRLKFVCVCACAYMQESSLMLLQASLKGELEAHQQQLESSKVTAKLLSAIPFDEIYSFINQHFSTQLAY